jgi:hypothetical protein
MEWARGNNEAEWGATSGWEGRGWRRSPCWKRPEADGRRSRCTRGGHMCAAVECRCVFYFFWRNRVVLKVERRRSIGLDRWAGPGTSHPDGRPCASIIELIKESREASSIIVDNGHRLT